jgi:hypothetical protein
MKVRKGYGRSQPYVRVWVRKGYGRSQPYVRVWGMREFEDITFDGKMNNSLTFDY